MTTQNAVLNGSNAASLKTPDRQPPKATGGLPIIGHTLEFLKDPVEMLKKAQKEHGELCRMQVANMKFYLFSGTEAHEAYFRAPDEVFDQAPAYGFMTPVFGKGVMYDATREKRSDQLGMMVPALRIKRMMSYGEKIAEEVDLVMSGMGDTGTIDVVDFAAYLTNMTSTRCLLGEEFRKHLNEEFAKIYHDLEKSIVPIAYINPYLPLPVFWRRDRARKRLVAMVSEVIDKRKASGYQGDDFFQSFIDTPYADGSKLNADEITGMLIGAMFAGHHTSATTFSWTIMEFLRNPEYLKRVIEESERVFGGGAPITYDSVRELTLLENGIKESLRMHPPLVMLLRQAMTDFDYKGWTVPKGSFVVCAPAVSHYIESEFRKPGDFNPDRFNSDEVENPFKWIAFGGGKHRCLGSAFALMQLKVIFAKLLMAYKFEAVGDPFMPDYQAMVVAPKQPSRVTYSRRA